MFEDPAFWALVGLVLFFALIIYMKVPRMITGGLDKRAAGITAELDQARRLREEAQALLVEYRKKADAAEQEAAGIIDQAKREAEALGIEAKKRMDDYVASRTKMAEQKIAQAEAQAVQDVKALSADVSIAAAETILAAKAKAGAAETLIANTIKDLRGKLN
jgi:F-type H+-transporting ATPase subunit b